MLVSWRRLSPWRNFLIFRMSYFICARILIQNCILSAILAFLKLVLGNISWTKTKYTRWYQSSSKDLSHIILHVQNIAQTYVNSTVKNATFQFAHGCFCKRTFWTQSRRSNDNIWNKKKRNIKRNWRNSFSMNIRKWQKQLKLRRKRLMKNLKMYQM